MKRISAGTKSSVMFAGLIIIVPAILLSAGMDIWIEEINFGSCVMDGDTICKYSYQVAMMFRGETGTFDITDAPMGIMPALSDKIMEASGGKVPKIAAVLLPVEESMKVIAYENNDAENNFPPEPRFPKGPGGLGVATNATIGWMIGDNVHLNAGFVGSGPYSFFACWDNDEEISEIQPQPAGCTPFSGGDDEVYIIPLEQFRSGKEFTITREFDTDDGDMWRAHIKYIITFNPEKPEDIK